MSQPRTRQELYDVIKATSKEEFILSEMKRLGFWDSNEEMPSLTETFIKEKNKLRKELNELLAKQRKIGNPEQIVKEYRENRMKESREKQKANLEARLKARKEKAENWAKKKTEEIIYLGDNISKGLSQKESDKEKLAKNNLPEFPNALALAEAMKITLGQLRFLAYNREVSKVSHYKRFYMQKKSGGKRLISAPMPRLKSAQYWILENILYKVPLHEAAHGFTPERSILSNATPHVGKDVVVNFDFKDFFPTLTFGRVKGAFLNLGYSQQIATILAALCTEPNVDEVEMDGTTYYVSSGERFLPQGAPTSPAITNIICYKLDARMAGMAKSLNFNYSRYADDMTFSASGEDAKQVQKVIWRVKSISTSEGFNLHPDKLRIMRKGNRQEVTGIIVNDQVGVDRRNLKKFRALLHQIRQTGMAGKQWGAGKDLASSIWGYANFVAMVKPQKGLQLIAEVKEILGHKKIVTVNKYALAKKENESAQAKQLRLEKAALKKKQNDILSDSDDKPSWKLW